MTRYVIACVPGDPAVRARISAVVGKDCVPYAGSTPGACQNCDCKVWVGPEQEAKRVELAAYERNDVVVLCEPCAVLAMVGSKAHRVQALSQKQWGE